MRVHRRSTGFTAEFGLGSEDICAIAGHKTALWTMSSKDSHPALGGGLFCLLQLPVSFENEQLLKILNILNTAEMAPNDLPPHFGAWTTGQRGDNPAYVAFLPNIMHSEAKNIHVNMSIWAHQKGPNCYVKFIITWIFVRTIQVLSQSIFL